jgi:nucleoside-diphosphate-sugar epimerase
MQHSLVVIGPGFTGQAIEAAARARNWPATLVGRSSGEARFGTQAADAAIGSATALVSTVPPGESGDPVLAAHGAAIGAAKALRWIGYCSTTGVYGDRGGAWVDETTEPAPGQPRSRRRLAAEQAWRAALPPRAGLDLIRIAGIYGPGRSALDEVRAGKARRVVKPGHAFGRIHVDDIALLVLAAIGTPPAPGEVRVLNATDDEPAPSADVIAEAARLLGMPPPPEIPFDQAVSTMSEMGRSFWSENRRVANTLTKRATGWTPGYASYREGLAGVLAQELVQGGGKQRQV